MMKGRVVKAYSGWYDVYITEGGPPGRIPCQPRGRLRQLADGVLTGDWVQVARGDDGAGVIERVFPRTTRLPRPPVANVDQVIVVFTLREPPLNRPVLDRLTCLAEDAGLDVLLVLNKVDLTPADEVDALAAKYSPTGYPLLAVNARGAKGLDPLRRRLAGRISVLAGPSGVGKTTLLNALRPGLDLETQPVSQRLQRGRHTTRHVELLPLYDLDPDRPQDFAADQPQGFIVDTPGFSQLAVTQIPPEELGLCFPELRGLAQRCRFHNCLHRAEPGCAVKEALAAGQIDGGRYEQYLEMLAEIEEALRQRYR